MSGRRNKRHARHLVTPRTHEAVRQLNQLAGELTPHLPLASAAARAEWHRLTALWPSDEHLGQGTIGLSESDLDETLAKVRRFRAILLDQANAAAGDERPPRAPPKNAAGEVPGTSLAADQNGSKRGR